MRVVRWREVVDDKLHRELRSERRRVASGRGSGELCTRYTRPEWIEALHKERLEEVRRIHGIDAGMDDKQASTVCSFDFLHPFYRRITTHFTQETETRNLTSSAWACFLPWIRYSLKINPLCRVAIRYYLTHCTVTVPTMSVSRRSVLHQTNQPKRTLNMRQPIHQRTVLPLMTSPI